MLRKADEHEVARLLALGRAEDMFPDQAGEDDGHGRRVPITIARDILDFFASNFSGLSTLEAMQKYLLYFDEGGEGTTKMLHGTAAKMIGTYAAVAEECRQLAGNPIGQASGLRSLVNVARAMAGFVNSAASQAAIHKWVENFTASRLPVIRTVAMVQSALYANQHTPETITPDSLLVSLKRAFQNKNVNVVLGHKAATWGSHMDESETPRRTLHQAIRSAMSMSSQGDFYVSAPADKGGNVLALTNGTPAPEQVAEAKVADQDPNEDEEQIVEMKVARIVEMKVAQHNNKLESAEALVRKAKLHPRQGPKNSRLEQRGNKV